MGLFLNIKYLGLQLDLAKIHTTVIEATRVGDA